MGAFDRWKGQAVGRTAQNRPPESRESLLKQMDELRVYADQCAAKLHQARLLMAQNDKAFQNIRQVRYKLMGARTLADLLEILEQELNRLQVDYYTLMLTQEFLGEDSEAARALPESARHRLRFKDEAGLRRLVSVSGQATTYIGHTGGKETPGMFPAEIKSCVLIPMIYQKRLIGCLNLGSRDVQRFSSAYSPEFLEDMAATTTLSLDNVITHDRNQRLATTDVLTGISNRRFFYTQGERLFELAKRHGDDLACLYIDLNDFKPINDLHGHDAGDLALKKMAAYVNGRVRKTDVFARLGGDEFALLLPRVTLVQARRVAEWLREGVAKISFASAGHPGLTVSAAFGVAALEAADATFEDLISRADAAMYADKGRKVREQRQIR